MDTLATAPDIMAVPASGTAFECLRDQILYIESEIAKVDQVECPIKHIFAPGVYAREMTIPAGTILTGKIHATEHINILSQGDISVLTEEGMKRLQAPFSFVSKPGTKRVGYAHTDVVWTTIHVTNETDLDKIEAEVIAKDFGDPRLAVSPWKQGELL